MNRTHPQPRLAENSPLTSPATVWQHFYDARLMQVERVQRDFEISRAQFDAPALSAAAWQQAADSLDRAYDACAGHAEIGVVAELCTRVTQLIAIAIEQSSLQSARHSAAYDA